MEHLGLHGNMFLLYMLCFKRTQHESHKRLFTLYNQHDALVNKRNIHIKSLHVFSHYREFSVSLSPSPVSLSSLWTSEVYLSKVHADMDINVVVCVEMKCLGRRCSEEQQVWNGLVFLLFSFLSQSSSIFHAAELEGWMLVQMQASLWISRCLPLVLQQSHQTGPAGLSRPISLGLLYRCFWVNSLTMFNMTVHSLSSRVTMETHPPVCVDSSWIRFLSFWIFILMSY